jgi:hypothetical protein
MSRSVAQSSSQRDRSGETRLRLGVGPSTSCVDRDHMHPSSSMIHPSSSDRTSIELTRTCHTRTHAARSSAKATVASAHKHAAGGALLAFFCKVDMSFDFAFEMDNGISMSKE